MTKIYLVRHAEAEGNLYRIAHGHYNGLITDWRGPKQIRALAQRFEGIRVDAVYSSDLYRTQTTAQAVYVPKHLPLHTSPAFREVHMGAWEGHASTSGSPRAAKMPGRCLSAISPHWRRSPARTTARRSPCSPTARRCASSSARCRG